MALGCCFGFSNAYFHPVRSLYFSHMTLIFLIVSSYISERDLVGVDVNTNQLCYMASAADLDETATLRRSLLMEHPHINIHTNLVDAHFYIMEKWVIDFVASNE